MAKAKTRPLSTCKGKALTKKDAMPPLPLPAKHAPDIQWAKNPKWTQMLITYLTDHPIFRKKLFSDSTHDSIKEQHAKIVAKDGKPQQYAVLAQHIFSENPVMKGEYILKPSRLRHLSRLVCAGNFYCYLF